MKKIQLYSLDVDAAERSINPVVIGRKNWLFKAPKGVQGSTALETAKANSLEPHAYLRYILAELPKLG